MLDQWVFFIVTMVSLTCASFRVEHKPDEVLTKKFLVLTGDTKRFSFIHRCLFVHAHTTLTVKDNHHRTMDRLYLHSENDLNVFHLCQVGFLFYCLICNLEYFFFFFWFINVDFVGHFFSPFLIYCQCCCLFMPRALYQNVTLVFLAWRHMCIS